MEYPVEEILSYPLPALFVLAVFYGIYFAKMLAQKRRGIRTRQIGQRKEKSIHTVELLMSMATLGVVIAQLVTIAFGWSCLASGIYRFSRNPAFLGFDLMYIGVMLMYCNLLTVPLTVFAIVMLHLQILQEERYLEETFGAAYREYKRHTFRYLGRR